MLSCEFTYWDGSFLRKKSRFAFIALALLLILVVSSISVAIFLSNPNVNPAPNPTSSSTPSASGPSPTSSTSWTIITPSPNPTGTLPPVKIVGKQIPPNYVMGFPVDGGLINGMNVVFLDGPDQQVSIRFTAKNSGTANKVVINAFAYADQPTIRVGLQADSNGNPAGSWLSDGAFGSVQLGSSSGFKTVQLGSPASLAKGQVYHVVIEAAGSDVGGSVAITTYQASGFAQPFHPDDPDITWSDTQMNILLYNGGSWHAQNRWPIFVVEYSDGKSEGQPYSISAQWVVYGSTFVGQTLVPASDYKVGKIAFDVSLGGGQPQDKLYYEIRDSEESVLADGVFAQSSQLTASQSWVEAELSSPVTLRAGELYRIVLLSPQTDLAGAYYVFGHEFCYDPSIGYGAFQHQLTSSLSSGQVWGDNSDADAIFKITTVG